MYTNVSNEFITANNNIVRNYESRITIGDVVLTNNEVINISFNSMLKNDNSFNVGNCISTTCTLTFLTPNQIIDTRNQVKVEFGLLLEDGTYEYVPYGIYNIAKESETDTTTTFIMYDNLVKLDIDYKEDSDLMLYDKLLRIQELTGVTVRESILEFFKPFDATQRIIEGYSCRELIGYIASLIGGDVCIDRLGQLDIKSPNIDETEGYAQEFSCDDYKSLSCEKDTFKIKTLMIEIGENYFEQELNSEGRNVFISNPILNSKMYQSNAYWGDYLVRVLEYVSFRGCSLNFGGNILLDLGDDIYVTNRKGESFKSYIHYISVDYNGTFNMTIGCSGETDVVNSTNKKSEEEAELDRIGQTIEDLQNGNNDYIFQNDKSIIAIDPEGEEYITFTPSNKNGNCVLGYTGYANSKYSTNIYGNNLRFVTRNAPTLNSKKLCNGNIQSVYSGHSYFYLGGLLMCWGILNFTGCVANTAKQLKVTFPQEFSNIPSVTITGNTSNVLNTSFGATGVSTTGFTANGARTTDGNVNAFYIAIGSCSV